MNKNINTTHKNNNINTIKITTNDNITNKAKSTNSLKKINTKKIINWSQYNKSLVNRGNLSIYVSEAIVSKAFLKPKKNH
ncbi:MAG: hypothetical protein PWQ10_136, partial [Patescibacteria group bacterium]|nr:hypothetical protein [Patescibacteria group bacterium]